LTILGNRSSVFVVDDDASMRISIKRLLGVHGFRAILFDSAKALFDHDDFDDAICIIIDINLNNQSGIGLRRVLSSKGITAPVIYVTGNDSQASRLAAIESGCLAYLSKPFTARSFIDAVERARMVAV
jgi:FixJ family two-component response regulator